MYTYLIAVVLLSLNFAHAKNTCHISNINDFYNTIKSTGPMLSEAIKKKEEVASVIDVARQRPNPELDLEYLKSQQHDLDVRSYTLSAQHVVEFGSKRDKRVNKAKRFQELKGAEVELSLFNSNLNATVQFQRVAQLSIIIDSVKEVIHTFDKVINKLSSRKRLNPEEIVSLSTLRLASNDYKTQLNSLENEKVILLGKISFLSNCKSINPKYADLKYKHIKFDAVSTNRTGLYQLEDLKVDLAIGELDVQKSLGYSNILIGPRLEYQGQGDTRFLSAGVSVSFALPLFQTNDGGKLNAFKNVSVQKISSKNRKEMLKIQRLNLISKIKRSMKTLAKMPSLARLEKKHNKVEKLFSRGVVSIPMTIESHRQQIEFLKSRFQIENEILDTYGKVVLINGNMSAFEKLL